jgi:ArsR family metal-binding transcriptional regulator
MLLKTYKKEVFRAKCNASFQSVHCVAKLEQDISAVLPYLNTELGGYEYLKDPPAVTFRTAGKLITVQGREIAVNALKDGHEAEKILQWLKKEINAVWERRAEIEPSFEGAPKPKVIEILKLLPRTNCHACGEPTCLVFATLVAQGIKTAQDCSPSSPNDKARLDDYMGGFKLDV